MTDLSLTIAPKSDQLNSDDLIGRSLTVKVTKVSLCSEADQPIAINFEGDGGKPYKPCKSMRRVMVAIWGPDGNAYAGRSMTLYRDDKVAFGGQAVGGIRISHMSNIDRDMSMALTVARASRKPYTVKPLVETAPKRTIHDAINEVAISLAEAETREEVDAVLACEFFMKTSAHARNGAKDRLEKLVAEALERTAEDGGEVEQQEKDATDALMDDGKFPE